MQTQLFKLPSSPHLGGPPNFPEWLIAPDEKTVDVRITSSIKSAEEVYILGYGFDATNNELLGLNSGLKNKTVYFTNFQNKNIINKRVGTLLLGNGGRRYFIDNFIAEPLIATSTTYLYEKSVNTVYQALEGDF